MSLLTHSLSQGSTDAPLIEQTLGDFFDAMVARQPDHPALVSKHQGLRYSYRELQTASNQLASALLDLGLVPGDRIGIWSHNNAQWVLMQLATAKVAATRDFGDGLAPLYEQACATWPRAAVPEAFYKIGESATPVLLLSGGSDPATPPRHAARVAQALGAKARLVVVPNAGHGLLGSGCVPDLLYRFIDAADDAQALALDTACITSIPRPGAFVPPAPASLPTTRPPMPTAWTPGRHASNRPQDSSALPPP